MSMKDLSLDSSTSLPEQESIVSLLREINSSLTTLKNQSHALRNSKCNCNSQRRTEVEFKDLELPSSERTESDKYSIAERSAPYGLYTKSSEPPITTRFENIEDISDPDLIPYGETSPLDDFTLAKFGLKYDSILETPEIQDCIRHLPPDDHRHQISATRGCFLRRLMQDVSPSSSRVSINLQYLREKLGLFGDFRIKLGTGHFWIRDYDRRGCYIHWDCVKPPVVFSIDKSIRERQCHIPASRWPSNWLPQYKVTPISPWRRIISCRGLSRLVDANGPLPNPYFSPTLSQPAAMHLHRGKAARKLTDYQIDVHKKQGCLFQLTYPKNSPSSIKNHVQSAWYSGSLYPGGRHSSTEFQSVTIDAISDQFTVGTSVGPSQPHKYWTILLMDAITWYDDLDDVLNYALAEESSMQTALLVLVSFALRTAATEWQKMASYFDTLLSDDLLNKAESTLLSPEKHDMLLFEDESFSRSRKYFWVLDAISTFIGKISEALDVWKRYRIHNVEPFLRMNDWKERGRLLLDLEAAEAEVARLEAARQRLETHLERTKLLRDGLFNASAVIESRAASELGRNVKLLTYVSIFYLPLSFCASLWSTTNTFSFTALAITMTLVALTTYILVFNVESIVRNGHGFYSTYRKRMVERMTADLGTDSWADRAKRFDRFEPNRRSTKPSDWYVLWAGILLLFQDLRRMLLLEMLRFPSRIWRQIRRTGSNDQKESPTDEES